METIIESIENPTALIENQLLKLTVEYENSYGLYNGKTGLCICYFILSEIENNPNYEINARILLDEISDHIGDVEDLDFANGLAGIGWGIEWLVQNDFVDANTDEILEDLDDELYKSVVFAKAASLSLHNGTLGKAMYFYKRLTAQNPNPVRYRTLCNQECLVLLTDEINETLLNKETGLLSVENLRQNLTLSQLTEIAQCLVFLIKLIPLRVNAEVTEKLICAILSFTAKYAETFTTPNTKEQADAYQYLLYSYLLGGIKLNDSAVIKSATDVIEKFSLNETEITDNNLFKNYLDTRIEHLLNLETKPKNIQIPKAVFDILASGTLNKKGDLWNEAWLLS